jgi:cyclophilin family peptidyl-prolyl cis-trans isomerase
MDHETKITYSVIATLIIVLGGLAYYLQPAALDSTTSEKNKTTTTTKQPLPVTGQETKATTTSMEEKIYTQAVLTTNKGTLEIAFEKNTPNTVKNFTTLALKDFYNGVRFHRVIKNFMIQTGDPLSKDLANQTSWGTGGPGYKFNDELTGKEQYPLGTVAMANAGPNTNGSQFFIVTANPGYPLPPSYTVFGHVTKGIETALAIQEVKTDQADRPLEDIIIQKVELK